MILTPVLSDVQMKEAVEKFKGSPDSAPIKRLIQETRDGGMLIDATYGRKTASVLIMDSDHVVLSALPAEKLAPRLGVRLEDLTEEEA